MPDPIDSRITSPSLKPGRASRADPPSSRKRKRVIPNKPVKYVVNTHCHIDHSSGLRAAVAEGATISRIS